HALESRVLQTIEQRLHRPLRVATLARECGMSERTLRRKWKSWGRPSLSDEINQRRIDRASQLLLLPDISVAEVGHQIGIESPAQFSRIFRAAKRLTPSAYRQKYGGTLRGMASGPPPLRTEFLDGDQKEYAS
ncbi:MAG TPA: helix-turn-helix transcriptional regulator, partial [Steroidobacteraceae bacterium]|nr:helix-turn-helix transcriptional regulator [Steroidobacteraceae bacterium]